MTKIGIIGGSGLDDPDILQEVQEIEVDTPYGKPSSSLKMGKIGNQEVILLARHGRNHEIPPTQVNYRANIYALKELGCTHILASTAVGSLKEEIDRGHLVILDQVIDFTKHRNTTFHDDFKKGPAHTSLAEPFCQTLRNILNQTAEELNQTHHKSGTVITIEGPRFSSKAESKMFQAWGADVINMSVAPEAALAKEAGICYAAVAMSTDYDCWKEDETPVTWDDILKIFNENSEKVKQLFLQTIPKVKECENCQKPQIEITKETSQAQASDTLCLTPSWQDMQEYTQEVASLIKDSTFHPDMVIGLSRGGLVPARLISDLLHIKNCYTIKVDHWGLTATKDGEAKLSQTLNIDIQNKNVLIIDDITDTGQSMKTAIEHVQSLNPKEIQTATLIHLDNSEYTPNFYGHKQKWAWIIFPWNFQEDMVNLMQKAGIENKTTNTIKQEMKEKFALDLTEEQIKTTLAHITYLKNKQIIQ